MTKPIPYKICLTYEDADAYLKDQADRLKKKGLTKRFGVYMRPTCKRDPETTWGIFIVDRFERRAG